MVGPSRLCAVLTKIPRLVLDRRFGREYLPFAYAYLRVPLHQVPEALQLRAIDQRARKAAPCLPEMQVAGGGADVLDVLRQDRSQELAGRGPSACGVRAAARDLPSVVPDPRNCGEARSHGRANEQTGVAGSQPPKDFPGYIHAPVGARPDDTTHHRSRQRDLEGLSHGPHHRLWEG